MPRTGGITKRLIETDPVYKSRVVTRLIHKVMLHGRKSVAQGLVYKALERVNPDQKEATLIVEKAIKNIMPQQEVRSRRVGGANYQVPVPLKHDRSEALAIRWLVEHCRKSEGKDFEEFLANAIVEAAEGRGEVIKKRDDTHKMADANKAFAHFRW